MTGRARAADEESIFPYKNGYAMQSTPAAEPRACGGDRRDD
jgi:hypothetical protein